MSEIDLFKKLMERAIDNGFKIYNVEIGKAELNLNTVLFYKEDRIFARINKWELIFNPSHKFIETLVIDIPKYHWLSKADRIRELLIKQPGFIDKLLYLNIYTSY